MIFPHIQEIAVQWQVEKGMRHCYTGIMAQLNYQNPATFLDSVQNHMAYSVNQFTGISALTHSFPHTSQTVFNTSKISIERNLACSQISSLA